MSSRDFIWRFTPSRTDPELLEAIFVQRESLLIDVLERIKDSAQSGNKHHMLLVGPRGIGKTHFVALVYSRVRKDPELEGAVRIAWLNEDETTTSFVQLLMRIYRALVQDYADEFSADWLSNLLDNPPDEVERQLKHCLVQTFQAKTLLILVENLDRLFDGLGDMGQKKWRSLMQEHPFTSILATSQQLFQGVQSQNEVFFGFFTPIHLKPLELKDAIQLLSNVAKADEQSDLVSYLATPEGRSRVRAIRHLAGGNHRIFIVLSSFITRDALDNLVEPFEKMADELTPYYQERLRWLSAQQRQVVELLCSHSSPLSPSQVAKQLLAPENSISTQFKRLTELRYVTRSQRGREALYELTEPLMRLASEVKERKPLRLLVGFLRVWYQPEYLSRMLQTAQSESLRAHLVLAIEESLSSPDPRLVAIEADIEQARKDGRIDELIRALEEKARATNELKDWWELGRRLFETRRYEEAIVSLDELLTLDPKSVLAWSTKGAALASLERYEEALPCLDEALALNLKSTMAWSVKGVALASLERYEEALKCYNKALATDPDNATVWNNKGAVFSQLKRHAEALECCDKALGINPNHAYSSFNRAEALFALNRWKEGFRALEEALSLNQAEAFGDTASIVTLIEQGARNQWKPRVRKIVGQYATAGQLEPLGRGLVQSLAKIDEEMLSEKALYLYRDIWLELGRDHVELEVPLRIFGVGIEYLAKKRNPKVLLDLLKSERSILEQLFGLVEEGEE